ncbi:CAP domain-containing protein [Cohnella endophytica]|uniref:CAP domain-containing protein n=1 Tax=Cohnella endophytica TaxID=2419778 RepID=A0A494XST8_9BACL|nr:CAP domain-containing protein [Cohnella endophytica]RKP52882.1 CAP domain-containing protein [Cohnella endophytica]
MNLKRISFAIAFTLTICPLSGYTASPQAIAAAAVATPSTVSSGLPVHTALEIAAQWKKLMQPSLDDDQPYVVVPQASGTYSPGSLKTSRIQEGVNAVNFYRFLSGLPYDIVSSSVLNTQAQYGSVLLASEGNFSHKPPKPAEMPQAFYDKGLASTSSANIYASFGYDDPIIPRSIDAYMEDSDKGNLPVLGHRRWLLNPQLQNIGIGMAEGAEDWTYSALQVFDQSRKKKVDYNYVAYPAQGAFPTEVFAPSYAWSISLNMQKFKKPVDKNVTVYMKRLSDNKMWSLGLKNRKVTETGAYFNVENNGYGSGSALIFRPDGVKEYKAGDRYTVTVTGLQGIDGKSRIVSYNVNFVSAAK